MPGTLQRLIDKIVKDIPHVCSYLDDILITGKSRREHLNALDAVLGKFEQVRFRLKQEKGIFFWKIQRNMWGLKLTSNALKKN